MVYYEIYYSDGKSRLCHSTSKKQASWDVHNEGDHVTNVEYFDFDEFEKRLKERKQN